MRNDQGMSSSHYVLLWRENGRRDKEGVGGGER